MSSLRLSCIQLKTQPLGPFCFIKTFLEITIIFLDIYDHQRLCELGSYASTLNTEAGRAEGGYTSCTAVPLIFVPKHGTLYTKLDGVVA